jgi:phosphatidylglycerophosphate synthase
MRLRPHAVPAAAGAALRGLLPMAALGAAGLAALGVAVPGPAAFIPLALFAAAAGVALAGFARHYPHARAGAGNRVTLARLAAVSVMALPAADAAATGAAFGPAGPWAVTGLAAAALAADGLDGWLARREGLVSAFGARFDMEVDALFAALLALAALAAGKAGAWVLALGFMRHGFWAAGAVLPWLARPLPESRRRKAVCVVQIAVLAAVLAPPLRPPGSAWLAAAATALLAWSFAVDTVWLWRRR